MPFSLHSHSGQFCKHAKGTLEDVVKEAIRQGFELYGLSEHVPRYRPQDLYPEEVRELQSIALHTQAFDAVHRPPSLLMPLRISLTHSCPRPIVSRTSIQMT